MNSAYILTADTDELVGVIATDAAMEEGFDGASDEHVMIFLLQLAAPVVFRDSAGNTVSANEVHLADTRQLDFMSAPGRQCRVTGVFCQPHERTHHRAVVAEEVEIRFI